MEEKKPAASPDPAEQVEELLAQARQTAAGRVSWREMDAILEECPQPGSTGNPPERSGCRREKDRAGRTGLNPGTGGAQLAEQRRQTARQFFGAMFLTLILLGGVFGALLVEESYRRVGMGSLPTQVFSARLTEEGIAFTVGEAAPAPERAAPGWPGWQSRLEPFLLPRGLRITVRALLGAEGSCWTGCDPFARSPYKKDRLTFPGRTSRFCFYTAQNQRGFSSRNTGSGPFS